MSETLLWKTGLSLETGQVMMSAPWSVRERAFSRKFSLKDSICISVEKDRTEEEQDINKGRRGGVGGEMKREE